LEEQQPSQSPGKLRLGRTGLLVSVQDWPEANTAINLGVEWLDLKDPSAGPLGPPSIELVEQVASVLETPTLPHNVTRNKVARNWSIAGGELLEWDSRRHDLLLEALGKTGCIKWALAGCAPCPDWPARLDRLGQRLDRHTQRAIVVHYADHHRCQAPNWQETLHVAAELRWKRLLIDTAIKDDSNLFDYYDRDELTQMVEQAQSQGIELALAGSIRLEMIPTLLSVGPAWIGMRGGLCSEGIRNSPICEKKIRMAMSMTCDSDTNIGRRRDSILPCSSTEYSSPQDR
jgi:uncharacterized protein (UPF0264 family)